ncbi:MAG: 4-hydroxy-tetrahydrodipicolinate reductase [Bacteroidota bacterium]|nr:4-hydroxy-tetrahydrodipicolinate reductase [Bacteroidota bacterium]
MNIALIGYGKMGKAIEQIALQQGHHIVLKINNSNADQLEHLDNYAIDVAIEFTNPSSAKENVMHCLKKQIPVVCGTTGWKEHIGSVELATAQYNTAFLIASNFSIGVNLFFELNSYLANLMQNYTDYAIQIKETHHTEKKDAPSGTAISLAEQIIALNESKKHWHLGATNDNTIIPIEAIRQDPAPGTHEITYSSSIDDISIIHTAHNRNGFALGAVMAAAFIHNKKGIFTMKDVLFKNNTLF